MVHGGFKFYYAVSALQAQVFGMLVVMLLYVGQCHILSYFKNVPTKVIITPDFLSFTSRFFPEYISYEADELTSRRGKWRGGVYVKFSPVT